MVDSMQNDAYSDKYITSELILNAVLAGIGYACLLGWELIAVFSPQSFMLSYASFDQALELRLVATAGTAIAFLLCAWKADWLLTRQSKQIVLGVIFALITVACTVINNFVPHLPPVFSVISWLLFGAAQCIAVLSYATYFSLTSTRYTAKTLACGSLLGTSLFVLVFGSGNGVISLISVSVLILASAALLLMLWSRSKVSKEQFDSSGFHRTKTLALPAVLSIGSHGVVYGFISIILLSMGPMAALIGGGSGILGSIPALVWARMGTKADVDTGIIQRISLPLVITGLLLLPFTEGIGRVLCCCLVVCALAHSSIMALTTTVIENSEFVLHPIRRYAIRQAPNWFGFLIGAVIAFIIVIPLQSNPNDLIAASLMLAIVVVSAFAYYGADESETKKRLNDLLSLSPSLIENQMDKTSLETTTENESDTSEERRKGFFQKRCDAVIVEYNLTPREAEVFSLLARGRTADIIADKLFVSPATVKSHIYHIYRKLGINSQQHLMSVVEKTDTK